MSRSSSSQRIWRKIEKRAGFAFPVLLKKILISVGFDSEFSLLSIKEDTIKTIEEEIIKNKIVLKDTKYENRTDNFKFDLGDRISILSLPEYLSQVKTIKNRSQLIDKENFDEQNLKKDLLVIINRYISKQKLQLTVTEKDIVSCIWLNEKVRCVVRCPICRSQITCSRGAHWKSSNLFLHIRSHKPSHNPNSKHGSGQTIHIVEFDNNGVEIQSTTVNHGTIEARVADSVVKHTSNQAELTAILR